MSRPLFGQRGGLEKGTHELTILSKPLPAVAFQKRLNRLKLKFDKGLRQAIDCSCVRWLLAITASFRPEEPAPVENLVN